LSFRLLLTGTVHYRVGAIIPPLVRLLLDQYGEREKGKLHPNLLSVAILEREREPRR